MYLLYLPWVEDRGKRALRFGSPCTTISVKCLIPTKVEPECWDPNLLKANFGLRVHYVGLAPGTDVTPGQAAPFAVSSKEKKARYTIAPRHEPPAPRKPNKISLGPTKLHVENNLQKQAHAMHPLPFSTLGP